ncbi:MAG: hypothetical protein QF681_17260, partial [Vicinamibacterales bacterium]|nr:hypothetical protein [Vicinamibacterales bacterium]
MRSTRQDRRRVTVGFISPPEWDDPSPEEFRQLSATEIGVEQATLAFQNFDWTLGTIAETEPELLRAATHLGTRGCDVVANVGTPFSWAGLRDVVASRERAARLTAASSCPVVMTSTAILAALGALGVRRVGLATTYYSDEWTAGWSKFVRSSGFEVTAARSLTD